MKMQPVKHPLVLELRTVFLSPRDYTTIFFSSKNHIDDVQVEIRYLPDGTREMFLDKSKVEVKDWTEWYAVEGDEE